MLSKSITTGQHYWHGTEITADEYQRIKTIIDNRPTAPDGYGYRLTEHLDWELYEMPVDIEMTDEEVL